MTVIASNNKRIWNFRREKYALLFVLRKARAVIGVDFFTCPALQRAGGNESRDFYGDESARVMAISGIFFFRDEESEKPV